MLQVQFNHNKNNHKQVRPLQRNIHFRAMEKTLLGIKPDAFEKGLSRKIKKEIIDMTGLKVLTGNAKIRSRKTMEKHYAEHSQKGFFGELIDYVTRGKFGAYVLEGDDAVQKLRTACKVIREKYAPGAKNENLVHSSDSTISAKEEIGNFFKRSVKKFFPEEISKAA